MNTLLKNVNRGRYLFKNNNINSSIAILEDYRTLIYYFPKCLTCKHFTYLGKCKLFYYEYPNKRKIYENAIDLKGMMKCYGRSYEYNSRLSEYKK